MGFLSRIISVFVVLLFVLTLTPRVSASVNSDPNVYTMSIEQLKSYFNNKYGAEVPKQWGEKTDGVITRISTQDKVLALTFDACGSDGSGKGYDQELIDFLIKENSFVKLRDYDSKLISGIEAPKDTEQENQTFEKYIVKAGDTISKIAQKYHSTVEKIVSLNKLSNPNTIYVGQELLVPRIPKDPQQQAVIYIVQAGDRLNQIAGKHGISINEIISANRIKDPNMIFVGQELLIPMGKQQDGLVTHTVGVGDSLWKISQKYDISIDSIMKKNNIADPNMIYIGQRITIS